MDSLVIAFTFLWATCKAEDYYYNPYNVTRSTVSGIAAYRSVLTLDWLAAEDSRQRELADAFETEAAPAARLVSTDCIAYARPSSGKVARLMLELLKNLEGDDANLVPELIHMLIRSKMLVETSMLESEPDLEALVKTPGVMMGEPHVTFPRILAMIWMTVTDPSATKKHGWCPINKVNKYLSANKSPAIAKHMRAFEPIVARARFIIEEFIQSITPINMYQKTYTKDAKSSQQVTRSSSRRVGNTVKRPIRLYSSEALSSEDGTPLSNTEQSMDFFPRLIDGNTIVVSNSSNIVPICKFLLIAVICVLQ